MAAFPKTAQVPPSFRVCVGHSDPYTLPARAVPIVSYVLFFVVAGCCCCCFLCFCLFVFVVVVFLFCWGGGGGQQRVPREQGWSVLRQSSL